LAPLLLLTLCKSSTSALHMEKVCISKMHLSTYKSMWCQNPEEQNHLCVFLFISNFYKQLIWKMFNFVNTFAVSDLPPALQTVYFISQNIVGWTPSGQRQGRSS
jgi:hypothetical protein